VHGESLQSYCVAVCGIEQDRLSAIATALGVAADRSNLAIRKKILSDLNTHARAAGLHGFEVAKNLIIVEKTFLELGILSNTLKMQRHNAKKAFEKEIA
jgi:long-chain acyl-CoA synthetase